MNGGMIRSSFCAAGETTGQDQKKGCRVIHFGRGPTYIREAEREVRQAGHDAREGRIRDGREKKWECGGRCRCDGDDDGHNCCFRGPTFSRYWALGSLVSYDDEADSRRAEGGGGGTRRDRERRRGGR